MRNFTRNTMMGLMLAGSLLMTSPSMAQGRGRMGGGMESRSSQARTSSSQAREHNNGNARTSVSRSESRPQQVERRSESRPATVERRSDSRPAVQENRSGMTNRRVGGNSAAQSRPATVERRSDSRPAVVDRRSDNRPTVQGNRPGADARTTRPSVEQRRTDTRPQGGQYGTGGRTNGTRGNAQQQENSTRYTVNNNNNNRPGNGNNRPGGYGTDNGRRPGGNNGNHNGNYGNNRPGNNGNHNGNYGNHRPGNNGNHYGNHNDHRPVYRGYDNKFNQRWHNCYRTHNWGHHMPPPARPYRPAWWSFRRPPIPTGYRYYAYAPSIRSVFGITFGTLFNASLNYLFDYGYNIDGYYNNVIYIRDAYMLNYAWPDVMLNYGTAGFASAQFSYSTAGRDMMRFNAVYESLCNSYGQPVYSNIGTYEGQVSWWGGNGQGYVTLSYNTDNSGRFYTYLSIGN